jgi:hypothetical protein
MLLVQFNRLFGAHIITDLPSYSLSKLTLTRYVLHETVEVECLVDGSMQGGKQMALGYLHINVETTVTSCSLSQNY